MRTTLLLILSVSALTYAASSTQSPNQDASFSDRRMKTGVTPIDSALTKVITLQGVTFYWDSVTYRDRHLPSGRQIGMIAQEVEEVLPELVRTDSSGFKSIFYDKLSAVLLEAVKEQQKTIRKQDLDIQFLLEQNEKLRKRVEALEMIR